MVNTVNFYLRFSTSVLCFVCHIVLLFSIHSFNHSFIQNIFPSDSLQFPVVFQSIILPHVAFNTCSVPVYSPSTLPFPKGKTSRTRLVVFSLVPPSFIE